MSSQKQEQQVSTAGPAVTATAVAERELVQHHHRQHSENDAMSETHTAGDVTLNVPTLQVTAVIV